MLIKDGFKSSGIGPEIHITVYAYYRSPDQPRFLQHQFDEVIIAQLIPVQAKLGKARASEIEHLGSGLTPEQILDFILAERILEEITLVDWQVPLRKKLFRFTTGISFYPAIEINPGSHF